MNELYSSIIISKENSKIPVFFDNKPSHSKYSPQKEGERFALQFENDGFFIIAGLAGGFHIFELIKKFPSSFFIVIEKSQADINFLFENIKELEILRKEQNVKIISPDFFNECFLSNYIPQFYKNIYFSDLRSWTEHNQELLENLKENFKGALDIVKADYSVQVHFGKIWQHNIQNNLKNIKQIDNFRFNNKKKCLIVAAGPSLDKKIDFIKQNKNDYFIISTDTGSLSLIKNDIFPDVIISLDAQFISHSHFIRKKICSLFVFDVCSNPSLSKKAEKLNIPVLFFSSNHPFVNYSFSLINSVPLILSNGSGTVTISAVDFAKKLGFTKIEIAGADFGYLNGKPYAKGTYLDENFGEKSSKIKTLENNFTNLCYRVPVIKENKLITTQMLKSYKNAFYLWCEQNNFDYFYKNEIYILESKNNNNQYNINSKNEILQNAFDYSLYKKRLEQEIKLIKSTNNPKNNNKELTFALLPLISFLQNKTNKTYEEYFSQSLDFVTRFL